MERKRKNAGLSQHASEHKRTRRGQIEFGECSSQQITNGRAGRVVRINLKNFMCHSSLEINLDLNTNYIIGRNGSGKSALLTALIIGLGGNARTTNRGANMKSFIKVGQNSSSVEITLSNTGPMAFNPRVFGPEITVVRNFTDTGGNTYKLKDVNGHIVSSTARDVNRLIDFLNIHVDNPVCILNQDVARTFLNSNDPAKKYIMFMKATNLESVKLHYKDALQNKRKASTVLQTKAEELRKLEIELKKWLKKYEAFKNVTKVESLKKKLEIEAVWAQINIIEAELKNKEDIKTESEKEAKNYLDLISNKDERKQNLSENIEQIRQQLREIRNEEEINQQLINTKKNELQKNRELIVRNKNEAISIENAIRRKENDKTTIEEEINRSSEYHQNKLKMIQERDANMIKAEQKRYEIIKMLETAENDLGQIRSAVTLRRKEQDNLSVELQEVTNKIKQSQAKVRLMKTDENNSTSVYGGTIKNILDSITAHKEQFKIVPKGPLGSYIKLKDKKWALAIEDIIGTSMLMAFCVDNQNDAQILSQIFKQICGTSGQPTIINSKFFNKVHNYSTNKTEPPANCVSMIDTLIIKDPVVMNCLIDQLSIENILLVPDNNLAIQLMSNSVNVPKKCSRAVTISGDLFFPDPNYRFYACRSKNARYLQVSASEAIVIYEEEIKKHMESESTVKKQFQAVSSDVTRLTREIRELEKKYTSLESARTRIEREISDLKLVELPPEPNLQILTEEMQEITKVIKMKQIDLEKCKENCENIKIQMSVTENEFRELKNISKSLETRMRPLIEQKDEAELKLKQINMNAKHHQEKLRQANIKLELAQKEYKVKEQFLQKKLEEAIKLGERVQTRRTINVILKELEEICQQIEDIKASLGDKMTISKTYINFKQKYDKTKEDYSKVKNLQDILFETVESRAKTYTKLAEYIGVRVREMFTAVLKLRQFKGTIEINHENQTLELVVIPQHGSSQGTGQTHILSGGERSYSTVAFLHALWQVMEYPFYFLDEFDVFMDKVNRRTVMDILLEHAKEHNNLQFVFLTPQDVSNIIGDKHITVHKMEDPDRHKNK